MSIKALYRKEWKQSRVYLLLITLLLFFLYPLRALLGLQDWRERTNDPYFMPEHEVPNVLGSGMPSIMIIIFLVMLAVQLIGMERNTRRHDFAFALPFKRRTMYLVKWLVAVVPITVIMVIFFSISYAAVATSEFGMYIQDYSFVTLLLTPWLGFIATYSFALFIGTITGEMISQIVLTFIFTIFPMGITGLVGYFFTVHFDEHINTLPMIEHLIWPIYVLNPLYLHLSLWPPALAIIVFLLAGQWLYEKNQSEYNGEFLIFKQSEPFFRVGIIICFAMLGGMIVSGLVPWGMSQTVKILFYWVGVAIFIILSYYLTKRLFKMNITVKGK